MNLCRSSWNVVLATLAAMAPTLVCLRGRPGNPSSKRSAENSMAGGGEPNGAAPMWRVACDLVSARLKPAWLSPIIRSPRHATKPLC